MAGVIVEIDAVLSQQSLQKLGADLDRVSRQLGTGLAAGANPAAIDFSKKLIGTLQTRFKEESGVLAKQLADGSLNPAQYTAAAQRLGKEISNDLKKGIASGGKLDLFTGEGGIGLRNQLNALTVTAKTAAPAIQQVAAAVSPMAASMGQATTGAAKMAAGMAAAATPLAQVSATAPKAALGTNAMRGALVSLASSAAGVPGPVGRILSLLLQFAGGSSLVIGLAAGIGAIVLLWNKLTEATRKAREETDAYIKKARETVKTGATPLGQYIADVQEAEKHRQRLADEFAAIERSQQIGGVSVAGSVGLSKRQKELVEQIRVANADIARLHQEWKKQEEQATAEVADEADQAAEQLANKRKALLGELTSVLTAATLTATDELRQRMDDLQARFDELGENVPASLRESFNKGMQSLQAQLEGQTVIEVFAERLKDINTSVVEGLGSQSLQNIIGELDTLRAEIDQTLALMPDGPSRIALEEQRNAIVARRNELQQEAVDIASTENVIGSEAVELKKEELQTHEDIIRALREQARIIEQSANAALQLADAFGLLDENAARGLQNLVQIGAAIPGALAGDPTSILSLAGGLAEGISTGFGIIKKSKDPERLSRNQELYKQAAEGDEGALDELLQRSGRGDQGNGLATKKGKDDAWAKYQAAKAAQDAAAAPGIAEQKAKDEAQAAEDAQRAKDEAEQQRLDDIRAGEERSVAEREQRDELAGESALRKRAEPLGDAIVAQVAAAIAESRAADKIAEQSPLGEDSPLARDARRRADEKIREAERAVEEAEREKERLEGKTEDGKVTPGFTVQRTITETSAGRLIGELTTHSVLLTQIRDLIAGGRPVGSGSGGGLGGSITVTVPVTVEMDGKAVAEVVGVRQFENYQHMAALAGNPEMG